MKRILFAPYINKTLILSVVFLLVFSGGLIALATPPGSAYTQNETLDPSCAPGDANCFVNIPDASATDTGLVTTGAQTLAGAKTFSSAIVASAGLTVGSVFTLNSSGNLTKINNVTYSWPSSQAGGSGYVLTNNGSGTLTWAAGGGGLTGATSSTGTETWLGVGAGANSGWNDHTVFVGVNAGEGATGATEATFVGYNAGSDATDAIYSIFMGSNAGDNAANATEAVFIGYDSGLNATDALRSTFVGGYSGNSAPNAEYSTFIGLSAGDTATNASYATFLGKYAGSGATNAAHSIFIGEDAGINDTVNNTVSGHSILIGDLTSTGGFKNSIAIGTAATNTAINQLVIGGNSYAISNGFFGNGVTNASPSGFTLNSTGGSGTNIAGAALTFAGGKGTGNALGGAIIFSTSDSGSSGTTLQSLTEKMRITPAGKIGIGTSTPSAIFSINMPDNLINAGSTVFTDGGSGLNDATFSGTYVGTVPNTIYLYIDATGTPDTFEWYDDLSECGGGSGVAITGSAQSLCNGISVTFGATTGHTAGDEWDRSYAEVTGVANAVLINTVGGSQNAFMVNVGPEYSNFIGSGAGTGATGGAYAAIRSNFMGLRAGYDATNSEYSNFIGYQAGYLTTNAPYSNFIGSDAGNGAINATYSNFIGYQAGYSADNATHSIFIGYQAGKNSTIDTTGSGTSILIGDSTSNGNYINSIALGKSATNTAANQFMIGSTTSPIDTTVFKGSSSTTCTITTGTGIACSSDERLKTNITDLETNILDTLLGVRTVTYNWEAQPDGDKMIGFLAQDLEQAFPELVATDSTGYKSVYYSQITPILVEAIRELDVKMTNMQDLTNENNSFVGVLRAWFASATNGITSFFAGEIHTDKICIGETCIESEAQLIELKALLNSGDTNNEETPPVEEVPPTEEIPPQEENPPVDVPPEEVVPPIEETSPPQEEIPPTETPPVEPTV